MANKLTGYYLKQEPLYHPGRNKFIGAGRAINVEELATLSQNKAYELIASEIERYIFTRGGGDKKDSLFYMDPLKRLKTIASSPEWFFHDRRNTLKHRAQTKAYLIVARIINKKSLSIKYRNILQSTYKKLSSNFHELQDINLWDLVNV